MSSRQSLSPEEHEQFLQQIALLMFWDAFPNTDAESELFKRARIMMQSPDIQMYHRLLNIDNIELLSVLSPIIHLLDGNLDDPLAAPYLDEAYEIWLTLTIPLAQKK